jgi:hypothetical protein
MDGHHWIAIWQARLTKSAEKKSKGILKVYFEITTQSHLVDSYSQTYELLQWELLRSAEQTMHQSASNSINISTWWLWHWNDWKYPQLQIQKTWMNEWLRGQCFCATLEFQSKVTRWQRIATRYPRETWWCTFVIYIFLDWNHVSLHREAVCASNKHELESELSVSQEPIIHSGGLHINSQCYRNPSGLIKLSCLSPGNSLAVNSLVKPNKYIKY